MWHCFILIQNDIFINICEILTEWQAPINIESELIECYHVIVDGCLATITSNTSCVVERIYDDKVRNSNKTVSMTKDFTTIR